MSFLKKDKVCFGTKLLCKNNHGDKGLVVGQYYTIGAVISNLPYDKYDISINNRWFSIIFDESSSIFPYASIYFCSEQEERKIKLQIINLTSKYE